MIENHEIPYQQPKHGKEIRYLKPSETAINRES